jgi:uroporphyrinogen-III synthase
LPERERRQVLITRPEPDASETAARVASLGWAPVVAPVLELRAGHVASGPAYDAVLVTSRNAIPALPASSKGTMLLAVGRATAARAAEAGFGTVLDADGDASELAALAGRTLRPGARVLVAHARGQGGALIASLRGSGFRVHPRRAYEIRAVRSLPEAARAAVAGGTLRSAMFLSAATARAFVRLFPDALRPDLALIDAVAIGTQAADALTLLPWRRVRVSVRPTLDHVLALL